MSPDALVNLSLLAILAGVALIGILIAINER